MMIVEVMVMRRLEERVEYGNGITDEWAPYTGSENTRGWSDADFRRFVREQNRIARERGDGTRLRSVEDEDGWGRSED